MKNIKMFLILLIIYISFIVMPKSVEAEEWDFRWIYFCKYNNTGDYVDHTPAIVLEVRRKLDSSGKYIYDSEYAVWKVYSGYIDAGIWAHGEQVLPFKSELLMNEANAKSQLTDSAQCPTGVYADQTVLNTLCSWGDMEMCMEGEGGNCDNKEKVCQAFDGNSEKTEDVFEKTRNRYKNFVEIKIEADLAIFEISGDIEKQDLNNQKAEEKCNEIIDPNNPYDFSAQKISQFQIAWEQNIIDALEKDIQEEISSFYNQINEVTRLLNLIVNPYFEKAEDVVADGMETLQDKCIKYLRTEAISDGVDPDTLEITKLTREDFINNHKAFAESIFGKINPVEINECESLLGDPKSEGTPAYYMAVIFNIIKYVAIIMLIVMSTFDFVGAVASQDNDKLKKAVSKFITRLILCVVIFVLPILIEFILQFIHEKSIDTCGIG